VFLSLLLLAGSFFIPSETVQPVMALVGQACYLSFYALGLGPTAAIVLLEMYTNSIRAKALSRSVLLNRGTSGMMFVYFLAAANGSIAWPSVLLVVAVLSLLFGAIISFFLPETGDHSLEDMSLYFAQLTTDMSVLEAERKLRVGEYGEDKAHLGRV